MKKGAGVVGGDCKLHGPDLEACFGCCDAAGPWSGGKVRDARGRVGGLAFGLEWADDMR
jgi:hypothetical protein